MDTFQVQCMIDDVARARNDLAGLVVPPERMARCEKCVADLETAVSEVVTLAWVPSDVPTLTASIQSMSMNLRRVRNGIDAALDGVIERAEPDEFLRTRVAMMMQRVLEFQLDVMMTALVKLMPQGIVH